MDRFIESDPRQPLLLPVDLREIAELLEQAEAADNTAAPKEDTLPAELARREALEAKLDEAQARARAERERAEYERKLAERESRPGRNKGPKPKPPSDTPRDAEQTNLTEPDSRLMRNCKQAEFRQVYNAQAAVDAGGNQLVLAMQVTQSASDANELGTIVGAIPTQLGKPQQLLADTGYANGEQVATLLEHDILSLVALGGESRQRPYGFRPPREPAQPPQQPKKPPPPWRVRIQELLDLPEGRALYQLHQRTAESVFGIIREVMQLRRFRLRGLANVTGEWQLVGLTYNVKRLHRMMAASAG